VGAGMGGRDDDDHRKGWQPQNGEIQRMHDETCRCDDRASLMT
jgi:hypothetical protein